MGLGLNLYMAGDFLENLVAFRLLWLHGRLGSGKTLLALGLARWLYVGQSLSMVYSQIFLSTLVSFLCRTMFGIVRLFLTKVGRLLTLGGVQIVLRVWRIRSKA